MISKQAHPGLGLELREQRQDLRLHGDVERGGRLVGDQHVGAQRQRDRDHDALALAARELVRVVVRAPARLRDADPLEQRHGARPRRARRGLAVGAQGLGDLPADAVDRVQMRERVLEDHRDLAAVDPAPLLGRHRQQIPAAIEDAPGGDVAGRAVDQVHDRRRRDALAGAALAEQRQRLAALDVPADAVHRVHRAAGGMELDREALDLEQMAVSVMSGRSALPGASAVPGRSRSAASRRAG